MTTLLALSISSYMQYQTFKQEYLDNLHKNSLHDLEMVQQNISEYKLNLSKVILNLQKDVRILNTLNLISNYQDAKAYDAVLFDEEKKSLFDDLSSKINNFDTLSFALFDKNKSPILLNQILNQHHHRGYFTYKDEKLTFFNTLNNTLESLPQFTTVDELSLGEVQTLIENNAISIVALEKIYFHNEHIGYIQVKKRFTQNNIKNLIHELQGSFSFVVNDLMLGNIENLNRTFIQEQLQQQKEGKIIHDENYYYTFFSTTSFDNHDIHFVLASSKKVLDDKISNLLIQLFFAFTIALVIAFLISLAFLQFNVIRPLKVLMQGIKGLNNKEINPIVLNSSDELEEIAQEFNVISLELKKSFNQLEQNNLFLENLIDSIPLRIFWKDFEGNYLGANNLFVLDSGVSSKEELIGKTDYELAWTKEEADAFRADDLDVLTSNKAKQLIEEPLTKSDGTTMTLLTSKVPLTNFQGEVIGLLGVFDDITLFKQLEKEIKNKEMMLLNQSKMASMGEMLENIAHQWRQPLSIITTIASGLKLNKEMGLLNDTMLVESLEQIVSSGKFLSQTVDDFRNFYKKDTQKVEYDIAKTIEKTLSLLSSKLKNRNIELVLNLKPLTIVGYENEMIQAFLNIFNNAIDALEESVCEDKAIFVDLEKKSHNVHIKIYDNAGGISKKVLTQIFEPRFTTKSDQKGTGIGLYMTQLILEKIKATIEAKTINVHYNKKEYQGALFEIVLKVD
jgi:PAS domain S-box-containing protein